MYLPGIDFEVASFLVHVSRTNTLTSPLPSGVAINLWLQISAVKTRHSVEIDEFIKFLTASSKLIATSLTLSGSVNGSTSLLVSDVNVLVKLVVIPLRIIF